ncbi:protein mono-ADP-ribosyltransferase PARP15-like isoform X1 [Biomphalaria pfeifferi]|uniref:Protein mono-ADP-ribosyltransferase PARP15-like isoform X1 n=1 Tax=Biomphalaria pfeifferi TaxID=112525 RepID=A0AAD8AW90_BIOPF|nr:protein mono-ADP-ribosyltransferase PARP15-like isoform X1 [Biomphalaria pfeifferi]
MTKPKNLLLINGFPEGIKVLQLVKFLQTSFSDKNVCKVWMDPYKEPRAVAMFESSLDGEKIHLLNGNLLWDNHPITFDVIHPTEHVFVRTYGTMNNKAEIELKSLFTASYNCVGIKRLDEDCYCVSFQKDWDVVQELCELPWIYHDQLLSLFPFFDCFDESLEVQYDNLLMKSEKGCRPTIYNSKQDSVSRNISLKFQSVESEQSKEKLEQSKEKLTLTRTHSGYSNVTNDKLKEIMPSESCFEKFTIVFAHPFLPKLLFLLNIQKGMEEHNCFSTHDCTDSLDFEIQVDKIFFKKLNGLFNKEFQKLRDSPCRNDFLALDKVQPDLKKIISVLKAFVTLTLKDDLLHMDVCRNNNIKTKIPFREYLTSLLISTDNFLLPNNDFENYNEWKKFKTDFRTQNPYCQIIVTDDSQVFLFFVQNTDNEQRIHLLKDIVGKTISLMWENCTSNIAASEHSENTNKCALKRTRDFDLSVHEKHLICHDVNKTEDQKEKSVAMITTKNAEAATNVTSQCLTKFHWMYEDETPVELNVIKKFLQIEQNISKLIEAAYIQDDGESDWDISSGPYGQVDFSKMTIVFNEQTRRLIRTEKFSDLPDQVVLPDTWQNKNLDARKLFELGPNEKEFSALLDILETELNSKTNKVEILKVQRLQNINLFKHFKMKSSLMQKQVNPTFLWQRIASDTQELVCQHGFHPIFCAIHDAEDLGSGNLFFEKAGRCLHTRDFVDNTTVCLLYSEVLVGKSGQGKRSMRLPPFDKEANVMYDSVKLDDAYMVFSDVQAYPSYFVMIKMIKKD